MGTVTAVSQGQVVMTMNVSKGRAALEEDRKDVGSAMISPVTKNTSLIAPNRRVSLSDVLDILGSSDSRSMWIVSDDTEAVIDIVAILIYCYYSNVQINSERRVL